MTNRLPPAEDDYVNVLILIKGKERYEFHYADEHKAEVLRHLARFAQDKDLSFTWRDAAEVSQQIRLGPKPK